MRFVFRNSEDKAVVFTGDKDMSGALPCTTSEVATAFGFKVDGLVLVSAGCADDDCVIRGTKIHSTSRAFFVDGIPSLAREHVAPNTARNTASTAPRPKRKVPVEEGARSPKRTMTSKRGFKPCTRYGTASDNEVFDFLLHGVYPMHIRGVGLGKKRKQYKKNATRRFRLRRSRGAGNGSGKEAEVVLEKLRRSGEGSAVTGGGKNSFARALTIGATPWRVVLTEDEGWELIHARHERGHDGEKRMRDLGDVYVIHDLCEKIRRVCGDGCNVCSKFVPPPKAVVQAIITRAKLEIVMFDLSKFPYPDREGHCWFLLVVDHFTKYMWFYPLKSKEPGPVIAALRDLFGPNGKNLPIPGRFHSDNGSEFLNECMETLREEVLGGIDHTTSRPRNPQCQGLVEERNKVLKEKILKIAMDNGWEEHIATAEEGERTMEWVPLARKIVESENLNKCQTYQLSPYL